MKPFQDVFPAGSIEHIHRFTLYVPITAPHRWVSDDKAAALLADKVLEHLREVVNTAKFFYSARLSYQRRANGLAFEYADDRFGFLVLITSTDIQIIRQESSTMRRFYDWYEAFMPSAAGVVNSICGAISDVLESRPGQRADVQLSGANYSFVVVLRDLRNGESAVRNIDIISKMMAVLPGDTGELSSPSGTGHIARLDASCNQWVGNGSGRRLCHYSASAPSNLDWSTLKVEFAYGVEVFTDPVSGERSVIEADLVLGEYDMALEDFFARRALGGFVASLTAGFTFATHEGP